MKKLEIDDMIGNIDQGIRDGLLEMEEAFKTHGDLSSWTPELLDTIDGCFRDAYMEDGEPVPYLFFPDCIENLNLFNTYCQAVSNVIRAHSETAPPYALEYFNYFSIWQMRGWRFPVPLGTASVIEALDKMAAKMKKGFSEVSAISYAIIDSDDLITLIGPIKAISWVATLVSWAPALNSKVFISRDEFDSMIDVLKTDVLVNVSKQGVRRKVRHPSSWFTMCH